MLAGLSDGPFHHLRLYSEVLQDSTFDLFDAGKLVLRRTFQRGAVVGLQRFDFGVERVDDADEGITPIHGHPSSA